MRGTASTVRAARLVAPGCRSRRRAADHRPGARRCCPAIYDRWRRADAGRPGPQRPALDDGPARPRPPAPWRVRPVPPRPSGRLPVLPGTARVGAGRDAQRRLDRRLRADHRRRARRVVAGAARHGSVSRRSRAADVPIDDPLPALLADPRQVRTTSLRDGLWVRPLDVAALLSARHYAIEIDAVLGVRDALLGDASYRLRGGPDGATCERSAAAPDVRARRRRRRRALARRRAARPRWSPPAGCGATTRGWPRASTVRCSATSRRGSAPSSSARRSAGQPRERLDRTSRRSGLRHCVARTALAVRRACAARRSAVVPATVEAVANR